MPGRHQLEDFHVHTPRKRATSAPLLSASHKLFQQGPGALIPPELSQLSDALQLAIDLAGVLDAPTAPSTSSFLDILFDAFVAMDENYRERSAVIWAKGFTIPDKDGIIIPTAPSFKPLSTPPPLRAKYVSVHPAVDKLNHVQWMKGQVVFIRTSVATLIKGIHFSAQHWALKKGTPSGRAVADLSNPDTPDHQTINGINPSERAYISDRLIEEYGPVVLPTLRDLVVMILEQWEEEGFDSSRLILFKLDLSGAYNLLDFHPDSIPYLAFALENDITVIHTTGIFGWSGTPYAFQVVSRVLQDVCNDLIKSKARSRWYIDDCLGISRIIGFMWVLMTCVWVINTLLGPSANNKKKEQVGRQMDMLGWFMNLDTMAVSISKHNMQKAIYVFFVSDINGRFTLQEVQRLASLACRYSELCPHMRPYVASLFSFIAEFKTGSRRSLGLAQRRDIEMWRAFLCLARFDADFYARPMSSFMRALPSVVINYDASLTGLGVRVSIYYDHTTHSYSLLAYTAMSVPFEGIGTDSSYQNVCEYTAVLLGDSMSSLSWMVKQSTNSAIAHNAHIGLTLASIHLDALVAEAFWLSSADNFIADGLSRGVSGTDLNLPGELYVPVVEGDQIDRYIRSCDPAKQLSTTPSTIKATRILSDQRGFAEGWLTRQGFPPRLEGTFKYMGCSSSVCYSLTDIQGVSRRD
eukprot:gene25758-32247_t